MLTLVLLVGNGFFVAAEFALVAAKRHRLERAAPAAAERPPPPWPASRNCH
ncbi:CNNM domain-containing protein [Nonomuraea sp. NBC_00507]|uniref:CNNM domain-containing protein n=1 Tax=Nonomuraea sp. NBC_00507 TaxID=2976002 RepID=UPI002E172975